MEPEYVSFEQIDREHREERARDAERLRTGEITPQALQEENSIVSKDAEVWIEDLIGFARRAYLPK